MSGAALGRGGWPWRLRGITGATWQLDSPHALEVDVQCAERALHLPQLVQLVKHLLAFIASHCMPFAGPHRMHACPRRSTRA